MNLIPSYKIFLVLAGLGLVVSGFFVYHTLKKTERHQMLDVILTEQAFTPNRFPVSVNPATETITDNPFIELYLERYLSLDPRELRQRRFANRIQSELALWPLIQQLASPLTRTLVIYPGERREEVVKNFGDILGWNDAQRAEFSDLIINKSPVLAEGKFYPGKYVVERRATPAVVAEKVFARFQTEVLERYDKTLEKIVPLEEAIIIASLIEREAYDFTDMRYISGIIWNRLFIEMPLQLDATLQYVRGSSPYEPRWWPLVRPADKFIDSPFNTYQEIGLPPAAIANPSIEAIVAALNPRQTDCMFYFHGADGAFYCTETYEEHVRKLREVYNLN